MTRITSGKVIAVLVLGYAAIMVYSAAQVIGGVL